MSEQPLFQDLGEHDLEETLDHDCLAHVHAAAART
jgi:hypothetical protein